MTIYNDRHGRRHNFEIESDGMIEMDEDITLRSNLTVEYYCYVHLSKNLSFFTNENGFLQIVW